MKTGGGEDRVLRTAKCSCILSLGGHQPTFSHIVNKKSAKCSTNYICEIGRGWHQWVISHSPDSRAVLASTEATKHICWNEKLSWQPLECSMATWPAATILDPRNMGH